MRKFFIILAIFFLLLSSSSFILAQEDDIEVTIAGGSVGIELELTKKAARMFEEEHPNVSVDVY